MRCDGQPCRIENTRAIRTRACFVTPIQIDQTCHITNDVAGSYKGAYEAAS